jgi:hypothetical protein
MIAGQVPIVADISDSLNAIVCNVLRNLRRKLHVEECSKSGGSQSRVVDFNHGIRTSANHRENSI